MNVILLIPFILLKVTMGCQYTQNINFTTVAGFSDGSTIGVTSTPNTPETLQINCTNPTDPLVIAYCNMNNPGSTPGDIAKNVTHSINPANLTGYDVYVISKIMFNLTSRKDLKQDDFTSIANLTDVVLAASQETFENSNNGEAYSTNRILTSIHNLMLNSPSNVSYLNGTQFGLANFDINCTIANGDTLMGDTGSQFLTWSLNSDIEAMISIPTNVICQNQTSRRLFYGIYRNTKLFVGNSTHRTNALWKDSQIKNYIAPQNYNPTSFWSRNQHPLEQNVGSDQSSPTNTQASNPDGCRNGFWYGDNKVMAGTLLNNDNSTTPTTDYAKVQQFIETNGMRQRMVTVKYSKKRITKPLHGTMKLTWWTGFLWSEQTCSFQEEDDFWVSECDHLTDFTLVVDGVQKDPSLCSTALIVIGYIINMGSIISLILLIFIVLSHRFSLFQAWKILKIFAWNTNVEQIMTRLTNKFVIIGVTIGFPTLMAFILGLALNSFYNRNDAFCWIRPDYIFFGVVLPITLVVFNGMFCLVVVVLRLFPKICGLRIIRTNSNTLGKKKAKKDKLIALFFMQSTLGIPWIFQYLTLFTPYVTAWHYLFTIVNGSQGMLLLFIYLYKRLKQHKLTKKESSDMTDQDTAFSDTRQQRSSTKETTLFNRIAARISNSLSGLTKKESSDMTDTDTAVSDTRQQRSSTKETTLFNRTTARISNSLSGLTKKESSDMTDSDTAVFDTRQQRSSTKESTLFNRITARISNSLSGKST
uniref:Uncharacterized protein n=1 Tax=Acrobeloides nanus TaxID=290746 RepID=A0A914ED35_9BILA